MPLYVFKCWDCGERVEVFRKQMKAPRGILCPSCGDPIEQDYSSKAVRADVFNPYIEEGFHNLPIEITSRQQRDQLCGEHMATYDRVSNPRVRTRAPWEKGLTWQIAQVKARDEASREPLSNPDRDGVS